MIRGMLTCAGALLLGLGCGHSDDEWQQARGEIAKLKADLGAANKRHADDEQKYADAEAQIDDLRAALKNLAVTAARPNPPPAAAEPPPPPPSAPSGWRQIDRGNIRGEPTCVVTTSVAFEGVDAYRAARPDASVRRAFIKIEYESNKACPKERVSTLVSREGFDCNNRTMTFLDVYSVDWSGKRTDGSGDDGTDTTVFPDESIADKEWKYVCGVTQAPH
jgi:hypothetical protein